MRVGGRAASLAAPSRWCKWTIRWAAADAAVVARLHLRCGRRAACGRGVGGRCACRRSGVVRCLAVQAVFAAESLGGGGRRGGCATFFGARSRCRVGSSRRGRAGASVVAQRLSPHGRSAAGGPVVGRMSPLLSCTVLKFGLLRPPYYVMASHDTTSTRTSVSSARRSNGGLRIIVTRDPLGATPFRGTSSRRVAGSIIG